MPRVSVALISAAALAYEILLMRLLSIIQWHHFAYMIISLALLGYGVSGTVLALAGPRLLAHFEKAYLAHLALFGVAAIACFAAAQAVPFNPQEILWDAAQPLRLLGLYLLLALPFLLAANAIGLAFMRHGGRAPRIYAADLIGAGLGSLGVIATLFVLFPITALEAIGALGVIAAAAAWWELGLRPRAGALAFLPAAGVLLLASEAGLQLELSPYKGLVQTLRVPEARVLERRSSPLGLLHVVESPRVPLRHAPGLSLNATAEPPAQLGVFTDGDAMTAITRFSERRARLDYLDQTTSAAAYHLGAPGRVLVLGAGGGADVLQALYEGAAHVHAVELNPQIVELVRGPYAELAGGLYARDEVTVHVAEARGFVAAHRAAFDLIQIGLLDSFSASSAGLHALNESHLYTVEALEAYLADLAPSGYLSITRWVKLPPRDALKLLATAVAALERRGVERPGRHVALLRGLQTSTLIVKNGPLGAAEIARLERFCEARSFDLAWHPGIAPSDVNRYNALKAPYFYQGARALLGPEREAFFERYKFDVRPATDDRPYFFHFFKWRVLPELLRLRGQGGTSLLEMGYLVLVATLAQALVASAILILAPLGALRGGPPLPAGARAGPLVYFLGLGLAFLFLEIAFIQRFILLLHHPLYAVAVVLTGMLIFAGLGSAACGPLAARYGARRVVAGAVAGIALLGALYLAALGPAFDALAARAAPVRVVVALGLLAPPAVLMGMPFPLGVARLHATAPALVPWVWGVNGCASVVSAVLATVLAIHFGFTAVVLAALALYVMSGLAFALRWADAGTRTTAPGAV